MGFHQPGPIRGEGDINVSHINFLCGVNAANRQKASPHHENIPVLYGNKYNAESVLLKILMVTFKLFVIYL